MENREDAEMLKKNKKKRIIIVIVLLLIILILVGVFFIVFNKGNNKINIVNVEKLSLSNYDKYYSKQVDLLPYYLIKNGIKLEDVMQINSNDLFKNKEDLGYTVNINKNNDVYSYKFDFINKEKMKSNYKLFSVSADDTEFTDYYDVSDGYILSILTDIEYEVEDDFKDVKQNNLEIQKYDSNDNLKWSYVIKKTEVDRPYINYFLEHKGQYIFYIDGANSLLMLNDSGVKVKELDLGEVAVEELIGFFDNNIVFRSVDGTIIVVDVNTLEINFEVDLECNYDFTCLAYWDDSVYSYSGLEYNDDDSYIKVGDNEEEVYGLLFKTGENKEKKVNVRYDYDKEYRTKPFTYDFLTNIYFNNGYIYVPLTKQTTVTSADSEFLAILIYDKDLNLINIVDYEDKQYVIDENKKDKFDYFDNIYFSGNNFYVYGQTYDGHDIVDTYTKDGKVINSNIFDIPNIKLNYDTEWGMIKYITDKSYLLFDGYLYKKNNYLKVTEHLFK